MKILLLHNYYQQRGGEDSVFEQERDLLRHFGHQVETLTLHNDAIEAGVVSKLKAGFASFHNPAVAQSLDDVIEKFRPDVMHVHNFFPLASPGVFAVASRRNLPTVMTLHNFRLICPNALLLREGKNCDACTGDIFPMKGIAEGCYRGSSLQTGVLGSMTAWHKLRGTFKQQVGRYIALNGFARDKFLNSSLSLRPGQVVIKPNFAFDPQQAPELSTVRDDAFLYVGRFSEEKGLDVLLQSFRDSGLPLRLIGSGPLQPLVDAAIAQSPNIECLGAMPREQVMAEMRRARAFILPSVCYENFPMTIVEALACGTPVITSRTGGLPEIVPDGDCGLLFETGSAADLTQKVKMMNADEALRQNMGHNARQRYLSRYTPEENHRQLIEIYEGLLA